MTAYIRLFITMQAIVLGVASFGYAATERPNIILIVLDSARADHLSSYGYEKPTTPRIDAIAAAGVLFEKHFSQATYTGDFLSRFFFSRYFSLPVAYGYISDGCAISEATDRLFLDFDPQQIFLTDVLSMYGYRTAFFDLGSWISRDQNFVKKYFGHSVSMIKPETLDRPIDREEEEFVERMVAWAEGHKDEPFFVYWHMMYPHESFPTGVEDAAFMEGCSAAAVENLRKKYTDRKDESSAGFTDEEIRCLRALYDSNLKHADTLVGALYEKLIAAGMAENTLLVITADHGENLGEHVLLAHGGLPWRSVTHVPLIMIYPPALPAGVRVQGLTESIDVAPTILAICGIGLPEGKSMDGVSLLQFVKDPAQGKKAVYADLSIRTDRSAYLYGFSGDEYLYDLEADPDETQNIVAQAPEVRKALEDAYVETMDPYILRYKNAKRKEPSREPVSLPVTYFSVNPPDAFATCAVYRNQMYAYLNSMRPDKPWLLNTLWAGKALFRLPNKTSDQPITLTGSLPDALYTVRLLMLSQKEITCPAEQFGFRYRFGAESAMRCPLSIRLGSTPSAGVYYYRLDLGDAQVKNNELSIEVDFQPPDDSIYGIIQFELLPASAAEGGAEPRVDTEATSDQQRELEEQLRSLGYL